MGGKQSVPATKFDPKLFARQVQRVRNDQKKNFYDWIDRECASLEKSLEPFAKGKVKPDRAPAEIKKLVRAQKKGLDKLEKAARDKANYPEALRTLLETAPDDLDDKTKLVVTKLAETGAGQTEDERREREKQLKTTLEHIARNRGQMEKVYGSEVAEPVTVLTLALALLLDYVSRKKR
ncbi:MAG: hypothetical protein ACF8Q5_10670 [Phycisphaerales bacterium JB040]